MDPAPRDVAPGRLWIDGRPCEAASGKALEVDYTLDLYSQTKSVWIRL